MFRATCHGILRFNSLAPIETPPEPATVTMVFFSGIVTVNAGNVNHIFRADKAVASIVVNGQAIGGFATQQRDYRPCAGFSPCWFAMWPDLGIKARLESNRPKMWIFLAALDSKVRKSTSHRRLFAVASPDCCGKPAPHFGQYVQHLGFYIVVEFKFQCIGGGIDIADRVFGIGIPKCWRNGLSTLFEQRAFGR